MKKISDKKKKRLKEFWSEKELFQKRFLDLEARGKNFCMVTWKYLLATMISPASFPHAYAKSMYPYLRYHLNNIWLVSWIEEHKIFDTIINRMKKDIWEKELEKIILSWEEFLLNGLFDKYK